MLFIDSEHDYIFRTLPGAFNQRKSIVYNLPARVCKFVINSLSDSLNTRANLHRWGRCMNTHCKGCGNKETLHHTLNNCTKFLNDGRYTWRHDNVLSYIFKSISQNTTPYQIFCDLPGKRQTHTTVPVSCLVTNLVPDLCIYLEEESNKSLTVVELTIPFEINADSAHDRKTEKYSSLINDLNSNNVETKFIALEIGSRGYINSDNMGRLKELHKLMKCNISFKDFRNSISKLSIMSSYVIYYSKDEPSWDENIPLIEL